MMLINDHRFGDDDIGDQPLSMSMSSSSSWAWAWWLVSKWADSIRVEHHNCDGCTGQRNTPTWSSLMMIIIIIIIIIVGIIIIDCDSLKLGWKEAKYVFKGDLNEHSKYATFKFILNTGLPWNIEQYIVFSWYFTLDHKILSSFTAFFEAPAENLNQVKWLQKSLLHFENALDILYMEKRYFSGPCLLGQLCHFGQFCQLQCAPSLCGWQSFRAM